MMWGVEQSGSLRSYRVLQKRGQIIDAEDFLGITGTYDEHPLSKVVPRAKNIEELKKLRKDENLATIEKNNKRNAEARNKSYFSVERPYIKSEFLADKVPEVTSIKQRRQ